MSLHHKEPVLHGGLSERDDGLRKTGAFTEESVLQRPNQTSQGIKHRNNQHGMISTKKKWKKCQKFGNRLRLNDVKVVDFDVDAFC